jgi:hypothetical protein
MSTSLMLLPVCLCLGARMATTRQNHTALKLPIRPYESNECSCFEFRRPPKSVALIVLLPSIHALFPSTAGWSLWRSVVPMNMCACTAQVELQFQSCETDILYRSNLHEISNVARHVIAAELHSRRDANSAFRK